MDVLVITIKTFTDARSGFNNLCFRPEIIKTTNKLDCHCFVIVICGNVMSELYCTGNTCNMICYIH